MLTSIPLLPFRPFITTLMECNVSCRQATSLDCKEYKNRKGFTLVEMSIVIVIIGLVVGGVIAGRDLIEAAQLRKVVSEQEEFTMAVMAFKLKYNAIPGDMTNATQFWGTDASCPNTPINTTRKTATCNGDGNGQLGVYSAVSTNWREGFRLWQQLANERLIEGQFTGTPGNSTYSGNCCGVVSNQNAPPAAVSGSTWMLVSFSNAYATTVPTFFYPGSYNNSLVLGSAHPIDININPALSPINAKAVDLKLDDGLPASGSVVTLVRNNGWASQNCTTSTSPSTADYDVSRSSKECILIWRNILR